ncbi:CD82 antigen-like [Ostrea edulis]|uniref:CD82 antigen-like n=1 Tax=Ostrea edulis TaxID=37623 RepID=UPI0024AF321A|nr:CD82 antigen-like [Ostrea edulis]XP_048764374.2 CD82 antigen-like [Ostrea edulis]
MSSSVSFLKTGSLIFNLLVFLSGSACTALGLYILVSDYGPRTLSGVLGNELYHIAAYVAIAGGASIVIISLCGCVGAAKESKIMLACYSILMTIVFIVFLTIAILVFLFLGQTSHQTKESMKTVLIEKYGVNQKDPENRVITEMWDFLQKQLKCCGVSGDANSTDSWAIYKTKSEWYRSRESDGQLVSGQLVPESCCSPDGDLKTCSGVSPFDGPPHTDPPFSGPYRKNPNMYHTGCYDEIVHYIQGHALMIGGIAIAAIVVMLFGVVFGVCLCRSIRSRGYRY